MFHYFDDSTTFYARDNYQLIKTCDDIELNVDGDTTSFVISLDYGVKYDVEILLCKQHHGFHYHIYINYNDTICYWF